jgi:ubiquinone/menaquinone biosynthesis C-methylase UbiE
MFSGSELARISAEYQRRAREVPDGYYCWSKPWNLLMHLQTSRACIELLSRASLFPLRGRRVADIGCGAGHWLLEFVQWGADPEDLSGIDLMPGRLENAQRRLPQADLRLGSASHLPWPDCSFDLVTQFVLFTSVLDSALKQKIASEMLRILTPQGAILWFDLRYSNPNNPQVRGVRAAEIRSLFPGCKIRLTSALLAPPIGRLVAGWSWPLADALHGIPLLRTHYAGLIQKAE